MIGNDIILRNERGVGGQKVLFADDDLIVRKLYQRHIELAGYRWLEVDNGRDALDLAEREAPHLAVLDIEMPERDGLSVLLELRKSPVTRTLPVILITSETAYY